jgi:hypothetical protein
LYGWGSNANGELGLGKIVQVNAPNVLNLPEEFTRDREIGNEKHSITPI